MAPSADDLHGVSLYGQGLAMCESIDDWRLMRLPEVLTLTGLSKQTLYSMVDEGTFPAPVRMGKRAVGWWRWEVLRWLKDRPRATEYNWR